MTGSAARRLGSVAGTTISYDFLLFSGLIQALNKYLQFSGLVELLNSHLQFCALLTSASEGLTLQVIGDSLPSPAIPGSSPEESKLPTDHFGVHGPKAETSSNPEIGQWTVLGC